MVSLVVFVDERIFIFDEWKILPWLKYSLYLSNFRIPISMVVNYRHISNISHTLVGNKRVDHSDVVGMMTSSNGNIIHVTGYLCGEFTGHRWIPRTKASDAELWCFSLICAWLNGWVNNGEAGDLRRHRAHYDVIVMSIACRRCHSRLNTMASMDWVKTAARWDDNHLSFVIWWGLY